MTTKIIVMTLFLSTLALAQSAPKGTQTPAKPSTAATSPAQNGKDKKDAAAKGSGSHSMPGNHKDVMEATAPAPATGGKAQPTTPAAQPTPSPNRPKK